MCVEKFEIPVPEPSNDIISYVCQTPYAKKSKLMVVSFKKKKKGEKKGSFGINAS